MNARSEAFKLKEAVDVAELKARAKKSCLTFLQNESPLPNGWTPENFMIEFHRIGLIFEQANALAPYFETTLTLHYAGLEVGSYKLITSLDGQDLDDYLVFRE